MTPERVRKLIDCYGAAPAAWPQPERAEALAVYRLSNALQEYAAQARHLDHVLARAPGPAVGDISALGERIVAQLPARPGAQLLRPPQTRQGRRARLALVAAFGGALLVSVVLLQNGGPANHTGTANQTASAAFDAWAWEEVLDETPERTVAFRDPVNLLFPELLDDLGNI